LCIVLYACYSLLKPYLNTIILAMILALVFAPIHLKVQKFLKGRKNLAALISCLLLTLVVVIPLVFILIALINQGIRSFQGISEWIAAGNLERLLESPFVGKITAFIERFFPDIAKLWPGPDWKDFKLNKALLDASSFLGKALVNQGGHLIGNLASLIGKFFLMIFAFFFVVRDEEKIIRTILHLVPLSASQEQQVFSKIKSVSRSALLGTFLTAAAQGAAGGFAFWIAGLPGFFWGVMMAFASLIPMIGTALIWVPASAYLFLVGRWGYGIFMILWSVLFVGMIDNFMRPLFMKGSADMSTFLIFFSILSGVSFFGLIGLLYGPLIFGLAMVLLYIYSLEFEPFLRDQDEI
jgi:predicted PurR-regulated permease PerM